MSTSYPIILAHGICPFDKIINPFFHRDNGRDDRYHYFRDIRSTLKANGFDAYHTRVSWAADLERRARDLKNEISRITVRFTKWPRIHIIAHSMGGLDSRWMIYRYQMDERVASLTTIGTPHLGSSYADRGIKRSGWLIHAAGSLGLNIRGFMDLTRKSCGLRNRIMADFEKKNGVLYHTIAGVQPIERTSAWLRPSFRIIREEEGENDGLVPLRSAMWKEEYFIKKIDADHLNQIGWWNRSELRAGIDRKTFERRIQDVYLEIARGLGD